jgi:prolyl-tRNA synthetase
MGVIVEIFSDNKGLVWPEAVAPFDVHLVSLSADGPVKERADEIYQDLIDNGIDVLYDDRDLRAGEKFADSDLIGIPWRLVVSEKNLAAGTIEVKERKSGEMSMMSKAAVLEKFKTQNI